MACSHERFSGPQRPLPSFHRFSFTGKRAQPFLADGVFFAGEFFQVVEGMVPERLQNR